jgi:hypothetical protein
MVLVYINIVAAHTDENHEMWWNCQKDSLSLSLSPSLSLSLSTMKHFSQVLW